MSNRTKRIIMSVLGVIICAISVAMFKIVAFGVDPFQTFMSGLDQLIPISFGTLYVIVNVLLLFFSLLFNRKLIGIATFVNLFLLGYMVEFFVNLFLRLLPELNFALRIIILLVAIVIMCFGSSLYITSELGVSTYDAVAITLESRWHFGKFKYLRIFTDVICVVLGCVLYLIGGGMFSKLPTIAGLGTIITAFFMGPLIDMFNREFSQKLLKEEQ